MKFSSKFWLLLGCAFIFGVGESGARAQSGSMAVPPLPDPSHIPFTLPKDIKWEGDPTRGELHAILFGDPSKPGMYGELIKWMPGLNSRPHFHDQTRYI
jgi:hypothetical protein